MPLYFCFMYVVSFRKNKKGMIANTTKITEMVENVVIQGRKFASIMIQTYLCVGFLVANLGRQVKRSGLTEAVGWLQCSSDSDER